MEDGVGVGGCIYRNRDLVVKCASDACHACARGRSASGVRRPEENIRGYPWCEREICKHFQQFLMGCLLRDPWENGR